MHHPGLMKVAQNDPRYAYEAYEFLLLEGLSHTQKMLGRVPAEPTRTDARAEHHINGSELLIGLCDLAKQQFGRMARIVFRRWGIERTDDWGEIVFNLVDAKLLSKNDDDSRSDFKNVFDLDDVLLNCYQIELEETE